MNHASAHGAPGSNLRSGSGGGYQARMRDPAPTLGMGMGMGGGMRQPQGMSTHGGRSMGGGGGMPYMPAQPQM